MSSVKSKDKAGNVRVAQESGAEIRTRESESPMDLWEIGQRQKEGKRSL
jgi:hypothetical protein